MYFFPPAGIHCLFFYYGIVCFSFNINLYKLLTCIGKKTKTISIIIIITVLSTYTKETKSRTDIRTYLSSEIY